MRHDEEVLLGSGDHFFGEVLLVDRDMSAKKFSEQLVPADAAVDAIVPSLVSVLRFYARAVHAGLIATADLPAPDKLQALPSWVAAWNQLSEADRMVLDARWWSTGLMPRA